MRTRAQNSVLLALFSLSPRPPQIEMHLLGSGPCPPPPPQPPWSSPWPRVALGSCSSNGGLVISAISVSGMSRGCRLISCLGFGISWESRERCWLTERKGDFNWLEPFLGPLGWMHVPIPKRKHVVDFPPILLFSFM